MICVRLLFQKNSSILIVRRANIDFAPGQYSLVGGKVQQNETALEAVVRKAKEEIGISINQAHIHLVHTMHRKSDDTIIVILFFRITKWDDLPYNKAVDKYEHIVWCGLNDIPQNFMSAHRQALEFIEQRVMYSEHGW